MVNPMLADTSAPHWRPKPPSSASRRNRHSHTSSSSSMDPSSSPLGLKVMRMGMKPDKKPLPTLHSACDEDEREVSVELRASRSSPTPTLRKSNSMKTIGLGLPSAITTHSQASNNVDKDEVADAENTVGRSPPPAYDPLNPPNLNNPLDGLASHTPPTQNSDLESRAASPSRDVVEDIVDPMVQDMRQRQRRATDAALAVGLQLPQLPQIDETISETIFDGLSESEIRRQLREVKRQLDIRDSELNMTASIAQKMLQRHEQLVSALPADVRALIPKLNEFAGLDMAKLLEASSSSDGRSRETTASSSSASQIIHSPHHPATVTHNADFTFGTSPELSDDVSLPPVDFMDGRRYFQKGKGSRPPFAHRRARSAYVHASNRLDAFAEVQQEETDRRLAQMEQALADARDSEEAQRKVAARLRKDFEKLQRDYDRAEAQAIGRENLRDSISSVAAFSVSSRQTPVRARHRGLSQFKGKAPQAFASPSRPLSVAHISDEQAVEDACGHVENTWGVTTFPQYPTEAGPSNWQSPNRQQYPPAGESPYTRKPIRPPVLRRERMRAKQEEAMRRSVPLPTSAYDDNDYPQSFTMGSVDEMSWSEGNAALGLPPLASTPVRVSQQSTTPVRSHRRASTRSGFTPPTARHVGSPHTGLDVVVEDDYVEEADDHHYASDSASSAGPSRSVRSAAPSPGSAMQKLASKMASMAGFVTDSLKASTPVRSLGSELRGAMADDSEPDAGSSVVQITKRSRRRSSETSPYRSLRYIPSSDDVRVPGRLDPKEPNASGELADDERALTSSISGHLKRHKGKEDAPVQVTPQPPRSRTIKFAESPRRHDREASQQASPPRSVEPSRPGDELDFLEIRHRGRSDSLRPIITPKRQSGTLRPLRLVAAQGMEPPAPPSPLPRVRPPSVKTSRPRPKSDTFAELAHRRRVSSPGRELLLQIELRRREEAARVAYDVQASHERIDEEPSQADATALDTVQPDSKATVPYEQLDYAEDKEDDELEDASTIPSRVLNDILILLGLMTEWLEVSLVIVYRVFIESRDGRRPNGTLSIWANRKRYYF